MTESQVITALWTAAFLLVHLGVIARVILRPHREPASRVAWIVVIIVFPVIGILAYIFLGETSIGRRRVSRLYAVLAVMPDLTKAPGMDSPNLQPKIPETYAHLFRLGHSVNGFDPVGGNCATLLPDSNATIESMVADIDAAQDQILTSESHAGGGRSGGYRPRHRQSALASFARTHRPAQSPQDFGN